MIHVGWWKRVRIWLAECLLRGITRVDTATILRDREDKSARRAARTFGLRPEDFEMSVMLPTYEGAGGISIQHALNHYVPPNYVSFEVDGECERMIRRWRDPRPGR
jgi:hypothetical protein